jgi:hypothetical protein
MLLIAIVFNAQFIRACTDNFLDEKPKKRETSFSISASRTSLHVVNVLGRPVDGKEGRSVNLSGFLDRTTRKFKGFGFDFKNGASVSFINHTNTKFFVSTQLGINGLLLKRKTDMLTLGFGFRTDGLVINTKSQTNITQATNGVTSYASSTQWNDNFYFYPNYYGALKYDFNWGSKYIYTAVTFIPARYRGQREFDEFSEYSGEAIPANLTKQLWFTDRVSRLELNFGFYL